MEEIARKLVPILREQGVREAEPSVSPPLHAVEDRAIRLDSIKLP